MEESKNFKVDIVRDPGQKTPKIIKLMKIKKESMMNLI